MEIKKVIFGAISITIGVILLPIIAGFIWSASRYWNGTAWVSDTNVTGISGLPSILDLVGYGFAFGLVGLGVGMIFWGLKK